MLIIDGHRRWVTGNSAACDLLRVDGEEIAWHTLDDFTSPAEQARLVKEWEQFLASGAAEGWFELEVPDREPGPR